MASIAPGRRFFSGEASGFAEGDFLFRSHPMKLVEPAAAHVVNPTVDPLVARAEELVREFKECFWFWHPEARVRSLEEIPMGD